jgi:hypothetical protein
MPTQVIGWLVDNQGSWHPKRLTFPEKLSGKLDSALSNHGYKKSTLTVPGAELWINYESDEIAGPYVLLISAGGVEEVVTADDLAGLTYALERLEIFGRLP